MPVAIEISRSFLKFNIQITNFPQWQLMLSVTASNTSFKFQQPLTTLSGASRITYEPQLGSGANKNPSYVSSPALGKNMGPRKKIDKTPPIFYPKQVKWKKDQELFTVWGCDIFSARETFIVYSYDPFQIIK